MFFPVHSNIRVCSGPVLFDWLFSSLQVMFPCLLVSDWMPITVLSCWVLDIFCIPLRFFLSFLPGVKFSYLEMFFCFFFQVLLLCSSRIFWSSALTAANYSPPLNQDLPEYTLYQCPRSCLSSPAAENRHHSWLSLFLLTFSDGSLLRLMDALISTLLNTQGDPLLIFGVSLCAAVCCLVLSPKKCGWFGPWTLIFLFSTRGICQASS